VTWRRMLHAASTCAAQQRVPATAGHALRSRQEREQAQPSLLLKQCPAAVPMAGHCWVHAAGGKPEPFTGTWRASPVPARARCWPPPATGTKKSPCPRALATACAGHGDFAFGRAAGSCPPLGRRDYILSGADTPTRRSAVAMTVRTAPISARRAWVCCASSVMTRSAR